MISLLCENSVRSQGLLGEHGLAYWLESPRLLFDTGQGMTLAHNAARLGIDLAQTEAIVLSHGHYDHVSGLPHALQVAPKASLWFHPAATEPKFLRNPDGTLRRISTDFMQRGEFGPGRAVHRVTEPREVAPDVWVTGTVPRTNDFEDVGGPFFLENGPDPILDDMALFIRGPGGLTVIFGCAHAGVVNTIEHIFNRFGPQPIDTLIGGLHLAAASPDRMKKTIAALRRYAPRRMGFCHCTGQRAIHRLWNEFPGICIDLHAGSRL